MFKVEWISLSDQEQYVKSSQTFGGFAKALKLFLLKLETPRTIQVKLEADKRQDLKERAEKHAAVTAQLNG